ncbi:hypothetical protein [Roseivivax sp.]
MSLRRLPQKTFSAEAGDAAVLHVDTAKVCWHAGSRYVVSKGRLKRLERVFPSRMVQPLRPWLKAREPFVIPARDFRTPRPIEEEQRVRLAADFVAKRGAPRETLWFAMLSDALARDGLARHKGIEMRSEAEILEFLEGYVGGIVQSLETEGFSRDVATYESSALVDAEGRVLKSSSGNHRFAIARALGLKRFPLRIVGVHEHWLAGLEREPRDLAGLIAALREVERAHA